jgi:1,4-alpha-glucan branching enzyme
MITKAYGGTGRICRVTFKLPAELEARTVTLCGDFNDWDTRCDYMEPVEGGGFALTMLLHPGHAYHFRYLLDNQQWMLDPAADGLGSQGNSDDAVLLFSSQQRTRNTLTVGRVASPERFQVWQP